jgi:hypothetical protein
LNINNLLGDLKTPDKCAAFGDFQSILSGNKTQDKFSHEKFNINSNSVEKFRLQKAPASGQTAKVTQVISQSKIHQKVLSDNKKTSDNSQSFKKMILKNQIINNLSDEKKHQSLLKNYAVQAQSQKRETVSQN